jgi:MFS family permease
MPVSESYILAHTPERKRSAVLGVYFFAGMEGGGILTPLVGYLIDHLGFFLSFSIASIALVGVTLVCSVLLRGMKR